MQNRDNKVGKKELLTKIPEPEIVFSFKYFNSEQAKKGVGQDFRDWESNNAASRVIKDIRNLVEKYLKEDKETKELFFEDFLKNIQKILDDFKGDVTQSLLSDFFEKLVVLSKETKTILKQRDMIHIYANFPNSKINDFKMPKNIPADVKWGTIQDVGHQKVRVAGFTIENIFYVVFLDKDHKFWQKN